MWLVPTKGPCQATECPIEKALALKLMLSLMHYVSSFLYKCYLPEDFCRAVHARRRNENVPRRLVEGVRKTQAAVTHSCV